MRGDIAARADLVEPSAPGPVRALPQEPPGPRRVFVDEEGRRARWVALGGALLCVVFSSYIVLLGAALVGAPWVPHGTLPLAGPAGPGGIATPPVLGEEKPGAPGGTPTTNRRAATVRFQAPPSSVAPASTPPPPAEPLSTAATSRGTGSTAAPTSSVPASTPTAAKPPATGPPATRPPATTTLGTAPGRGASHRPTTTAKPGRR